jgi:GrpB-like predicted nucleotidyltransferase (UPF0157 family)
VTAGDERARAEEIEQVLLGGLQRVRPVIAEPDPAWPRRFAQERDRIAAALGARALQIEHIGSTAVPGLAAKPIVDILLVVERADDEDAFAPALEPLGYVLRVREPGHRMLRGGADDVNLHVYDSGAPDAEAYLLLRDWLRTHPRDRARYAALKQRLARREWADINLYADAKGPLIRELLARARAEAQGA